MGLLILSIIIISVGIVVSDAQVANLTGICADCQHRRNQKDYYANPSDCHSYVQCFYNADGTYTAYLHDCPVGTFWNDKILQCVPEGPVPCEDKCLANLNNQQRVSCFGSSTSCSSFFVCSNTISYPFCCPPNTRFNASSCQCDEDVSCTDSCSLPTVRPATVRPSVIVNQQLEICQDSYGAYLQAIPDNLNKFNSLEIHDPSNINFADSTTYTTVTLSCASGSQFNLDTCQCSNFVELGQGPTPSPVVLYLPFEGDANDQSSSKLVNFLFGDVELAMLNSTAAHGTGSLSVNGGRLEIPGLQTVALGKQASWCLFYRCQNDNCSSNGGLLSNSKDSSSSEFSIKIASLIGNQVTASVGLFNPDGVFQVSGSAGSSSSGQFTQICVVFTGSEVQLYVNKQLVQSVATSNGDVQIGHCPYVIGTDQSIGDFHGFIDDVVVAKKAFTPHDISSHFDGHALSIVSPQPNVNPAEGRIYGGRFGSPTQFPFIAYLRIYWKSLPINTYIYCGGSLISNKWVLTAAHCFKPPVNGDKQTKVEIYLGYTNIAKVPRGESGPYSTSRTASKVLIHEYFSFSSINMKTGEIGPYDIAMVMLDSEVHFGEAGSPLQPVELPDSVSACKETDESTASVDGVENLWPAGWGATQNANSSNDLLYTEVQIISRRECSKAWTVTKDSQFCAYGVERGVNNACSGDGGGPAAALHPTTQKPYIFGIISYAGNPCNNYNQPSVYTRVCSFIGWIRSYMSAFP